MSFTESLGDVLFTQGWSLGEIAEYVGPETESRLVRDTGYDDTGRRNEMCLDGLMNGSVITGREYISALEKSMQPSTDYADARVQPAPQIEAVLPNGQKVVLGETANEPKKPTI